MKRVQFITNSKTPIRSFIELCCQLNNRISDDIEYVLYLEGVASNDYKGIASGCKISERLKVIYINEKGQLLTSNDDSLASVITVQNLSNQSCLKQGILYKVWIRLTESEEEDSAKWNFRETIKPLVKSFIEQRKINENLRKWYNPREADLVIVYSDLRIGSNAHMIKKAKRAGVPVIVAPTVRLPIPNEMADGTGEMYRCIDRNHLRFFERIAHWKYRNSEISTDKTFGFRIPPYKMIVYDFWGVLPNNPWIMGTGNSTFAAYSDEDNYEYAVKHIGKEYRGSIGIFNSIEETSIIDRYKNNREIDRKKIREKYNLTKDKIVCLALSSYSKSSAQMTLDEELMVYKQIIDCICLGYQELIISLHPVMNNEEYSCLIENHTGIRIIEEPLYLIVDAIDILIFSSNSSVKNLIRNIPINSIMIPHDEIMNTELSNKTKEKLSSLKDIDSDVSTDAKEKRDFVDYIVKEFF